MILLYAKIDGSLKFQLEKLQELREADASSYNTKFRF